MAAEVVHYLGPEHLEPALIPELTLIPAMVRSADKGPVLELRGPPGAPGPGVPDDSNVTTDTFGDRTRCVAPVDTVYGLPTACLGDYFDLDLDDQQGYADVEANALFQAFLAELDPEEAQDGELLTRSLRRRGVWDDIKGLGRKAVSGVKELGGAIIDKTKQALSISPSFNKDFPFQIPNPSSNDAGAKTPKRHQYQAGPVALG